MIGCKPLSELEIEALLAQLSNPRDRVLILLGLKSGFRISELLSIKIADLLEYKGALKGSITVSRANMKGKHSSRSVPISKAIQDALRAYMAELPKGQIFLFTSQKGTPLSRKRAWRMIKTAANEAGITGKVATHSLRKTLAMNAYKASGKDLVLTQKVLGHKSVNSTISYLQTSHTDILDLFNKLS